MITYEAIYDEDSENIFSVSLVESPAMESAFIALSKQEVIERTIKLAEVDKKEHTLLGVVLIPDRPVYRNQDGKEFYVTFPKETIKASAHDFFKKGFHRNSSLEHETKLTGISFVESWMIADPKNDTANAYNLPKEDIVEGAWVMKMKCDNEEVYQKALDGEIKGFSIDGLFKLNPTKEVNLKSDNKMESNLVNDFITDVKTALGLNKPEVEVKLGSVLSGENTLYFDGEMLEIGGAVWLLGEDETKVPLPVGEYPLDEKEQILVVSEEGVVGEIKEAVVEEAPAELAEPEAPSEGVLNQIKSLLIKYNEDNDAKFNALSIRFDEMKKENDTLKVELAEVSKEPAAKKIVATPVQLTAKGRILDKLRNN